MDNKYVFSELQCQYISHQLLSALAYLQSNQILHRDIKPANVLVSKHCVIKLTDFGLSRILPGAVDEDFVRVPVVENYNYKKMLPITNNVVTLWYRSPELLLGSVQYSYGVDLWSVGCIIAELELRKPLFAGLY